MDLVSHLEHSSWTPALEHDLGRFPLSTYLDRLDRNYTNDQDSFLDGEFPEKFLNYLEGQVSNHSAAKPSVTFISSCLSGKIWTLQPSLPVLLGLCYICHRQSPN